MRRTDGHPLERRSRPPARNRVIASWSAMSHPLAPWKGDRSVRHLVSYGGRSRRGVVVYEPTDEQQLIELLGVAGDRGVSVGPLGACLSFDGQGFADHVAISTRHFRGLKLDAARRHLVAGAGVTTGDALAATSTRGLAIPVMPSASGISLGGSISSDAYSRMTPGWGRESRHLRHLRLATPRGEPLFCSRERNVELFRAAVGGFGLAGIITEVGYELAEVGERPALESSAHAFDGVDGLEYLFPEQRPAGLSAGDWPGAGCIVMQSATRRFTMISRHRIIDTPRRHRTTIHTNGPSRVALELLVRELPALATRLWQTNWVPGKGATFIDDLASATFFMDGNIRAGRLARRLGRRSRILQQSFVLPIEARSSAEVDRVEAFVREALDRLRDADHTAGMFDVGFLPRGEAFASSANPHRDAFLVSMAFMVRREVDARSIERIFAKLTRVCRSIHDGKIHLTKHAECGDELLREMYGEAIAKLAAVRSEHDPSSVIDTVLGRRLGLSGPRRVALAKNGAMMSVRRPVEAHASDTHPSRSLGHDRETHPEEPESRTEQF